MAIFYTKFLWFFFTNETTSVWGTARFSVKSSGWGNGGNFRRSY
jgi:hypothetical protein